MVKKTVFTFSLLVPVMLMLCLACACSDSGDDKTSTAVSLSTSVSSLSFDCAGASQTVTVTSNHEWAATVSDDSWISVSPSYSVESSAVLTVTVDANTTPYDRTGTVTISAGSSRAAISVAQSGDETADAITCFLDGYSLVWNDEFEEGSVLGDDWTHEVQSAGWVNNELQTYVDGSVNGKRVTELSNGKLCINCFKGSDDKIYSARVYAKVDTGWKYGYFEARILLPQGKGTWPAWWMMPANNDYTTNPWPGCGEIDIMEEVGYNANYVSSTIHCNKYNNGGTSTEHAEIYVSTAESAYHNYGCEWTSEYLKFYVDEELILTYNNDGSGTDAWPFTYAFYPILNLAWGGSWGGLQGVDESALPVTMKVEYVRIFQKN